MNDLISRQAVLDKAYIMDLADTGNDIQVRVVDVDDIMRLPSKPRWIPVSERLPEEGEGVLWCTPNGYVCSGCVLLGHPIDDCGHQGCYIAWMPLPEPYCGAKMDGEDDG